MPLLRRACLLFFIPAVITTAAFPESRQEQDLTIIPMIMEGRYQGASATGVIDAPPGLVWKIISDYDGADRFMPNIIESRAIRREENRVWTRTICGIGPFRVLFYARSIERQEQGELAFQQLEGPFTKNRGSWTVRPMEDGRTSLTYNIELDHVLIPTRIRRHLLHKSLPGLFAAVRQRALRLREAAKDRAAGKLSTAVITVKPDQNPRKKNENPSRLP